MRKFAFILVLPLLFDAAQEARAQIFATYRCVGGLEIPVVFYSQPRSMSLQLDGKAMTLPQRLSGSGARYARGGVSFWIKGKDAVLRRRGAKPVACSAS